MSNKKQVIQITADKLLAAAKIATSDTSVTSDAQAAKVALVTMLSQTLKHGTDSPIADALKMAHEAEEFDALDIIRDFAESVVTRVPSYNKASDLQATTTLFAIPVISFVVGGLKPESRDLPDTDNFDLLAKSIKKAGIFSKDASVLLMRKLYHPDELGDLGFLEVSRILQNIFKLFTQNDPAAEASLDFGGSKAPTRMADENTMDITLRFLVGLVIENGDKPDLFQTDYDDEQNPRYEEWSREAEKTLHKCMLLAESDTLVVLPPDEFFESFRTGLTAYADMGIMAGIHDGLTQKQATPRGAWVLVAPFELDNHDIELHISVLSRMDNSLLMGYVRKFWEHENPEEITDLLLGDLAEMGFHKVSLYEDVVPAQTCPCCGEALFSTPHGLEHYPPPEGRSNQQKLLKSRAILLH